MTVNGHRVLYGWTPSTGEHCYYDLTADVFLTDADYEDLRHA